jgi:hypothetical protein
MQIHLIIHVGVQTVCIMCNMLKIILTADCTVCYISVLLSISGFHTHFLKSRFVTKYCVIRKHFNLNCYVMPETYYELGKDYFVGLGKQIALHSRHV